MRMQNEALIVAKVLAEFGAPCYVVRNQSYQTSRHNVYGLQRHNGIKISRVTDLADEVDEALTDKLGRAVHVRFLYAPLAISIPREVPEIVPMRRLLKSVPKVTGDNLPVMFGEFYDHSSISRGVSMTPSPLAIDLTDPMTPHALIGGGTGAGKTVVLKNMILSLAVGVSPEKVGMVLIDPKGRDFATLWDLPHLAHGIVSNVDHFVPVLNAIVAEMDRRSAIFESLCQETNPERANQLLASRIGPRLVVVVDELADLIDQVGKPAQDAIQRLSQKGRGLGIHLILGTQKPEASFIGGLTKTNVPVRACGVVSEMEHGKHITGIKGSVLNAHRLGGNGDFLLTMNGSRVLPFQSGFVDPGEDGRIVANLHKWWGNRRSAFRLQVDNLDDANSARSFAMDTPATSGPATKRPVIDRVHGAMIDEIMRYFESEGDWPTGYRVQQIHQIKFGKQLNSTTAQRLLSAAQSDAVY